MLKTVRVAANISTCGYLMSKTVKGTVNINYWWTPYV